MFGALLGALGPVGWVAGGLITVATVAAASSSGGSSRSTNSASVKRKYKEDKSKKIQDDIDEYIVDQIAHIGIKYNTIILINDIIIRTSSKLDPILSSSFNTITDTITDTLKAKTDTDISTIVIIVKKDESLQKEIKKLKSNTDEISSVIEILRGSKIETLS
jgi:Fe2+ transport system protein B